MIGVCWIIGSRSVSAQEPAPVRYKATLLAGQSLPQGAFGDDFDSNTSVGVNLQYYFSNHVAVGIQGIYQFQYFSKGNPDLLPALENTGQIDYLKVASNYHSLVAALYYYITQHATRPYLFASGGLYRRTLTVTAEYVSQGLPIVSSELTKTLPGCGIGAGIEIDFIEPYGFFLSGSYHFIFGEEEDGSDEITFPIKDVRFFNLYIGAYLKF